ncbi:MAG: DEAD/DEAH box helicase [Methyloceanibacter sp.]|nr:MAG: DEAD/DEAH box helicase [Methyloceanibacter sp.]
MSSTVSKTAARSSRERLDPEQERIVAHIHAHPSVAIWVEMGELGKTLPVLTALAELLDGWEINKALVIAHKRIASDTWHAEIEKWAHLSHLRYARVVGSAERRIAALETDVDIYIVNRENVVWLVERYGKRWPFDAVVLDEATSFKNPKSKRFRALKRTRHKIDNVIEMTGTPSPNGYLDLWAQIYLLDGGERLGKTFTQYKQRYFEPDWSGFNWTLKPGAKEKIHAAIDDICLRVEVPEHLKVPYTVDYVPVTLPPDVQAEYRQLEREFLLEFADGVIVETPSAAALRNKLLQLCNGAVYYEIEGEPRRTHFRHSVKLDCIKGLIADADSPVILAYSFESDRDRVLADVPGALSVTSPQYREADWNAKRIPVLVGHPESFGHGLNLQFGGHNVVWYGVTVNLEHWLQLNKRVARRGQTNDVKVFVPYAVGTVEEDAVGRINEKDASQKGLFAAMVEGARRRDVQQKEAA